MLREEKHRAWQEHTYQQARAREEYARYMRAEYELSFQRRKRRMEIFFVVLCLFFILIWFAPAIANQITASHSKAMNSSLDDEVGTATGPPIDVFEDLHRRMSERFVLRPTTPEGQLTDEIVAASVQQLSEEDRARIREVR